MTFKIAGEADAFEVRVKRPFHDPLIAKRIKNLKWDGFTLCHIDDLNGSAINCVGEKENLKIRTFGVFVDPGFSDIDRGVGF